MQKLNFISDFTEEEKRKHFDDKKQLEPLTESVKKRSKDANSSNKKREVVLCREVANNREFQLNICMNSRY